MSKLRFLLNVFIKYVILVVTAFNVLYLFYTNIWANVVYAEYRWGVWRLQWSQVYGNGGHSQFAQPIGDLDGDGVNEVIVGGYEQGSGKCRVLSFDAATGTYIEEYSWTHGGGKYNFPSGATILDLDGDSALELVVSWVYSGLNDGVWAYKWDGTTLTPLDHWYGGLVFDVYSDDIDGDGLKEVLIANAPWGVTSDAHVIVLGWQNGHFVEKAKWLHPSYPEYECMMLWTGDVNLDGKIDIVISIAKKYYASGGTWALNWDPDTNTWTYTPVYTSLINGGTHYGVVVGDINGNGIPEIGIGNNPPGYTGAGAVLVEWYPTTSTYREVWKGTWATEYGIIEAVYIGDADNDGYNEFIAGGGYIHIIGWDGTKYYEKATIRETAGLLSGVIIGDCDSDGKNEIKACDILGYGPGMEWIFKFERIDINPPATTHDYDGLWHKSDFHIRLVASDDLSGVKETFYRVNYGSVKRLSVDGHPLITVEGANNTLEFWSVDNAGNEEAHKFLFNIKLDKKPPFGKMSVNEGRKFTNSTDVVLRVEYYDNASGVIAVRFSNDGFWDTEQWESVDQSTRGFIIKNWSLLSGEGVKTVYCQLRDFVGFISQTFNSSIILDVTGPTTSHDYDGAWRNSDFYINLIAYDNLGGTEIFYRINGGVVKNVIFDGQPFIVSEGGNNTLEFWSVDEAGNVEKHNFLFEIKLDKTPPTIVFDLVKKTVEVGETLTMDASKSFDSCSGIRDWFWLFGDGTNATGPIVKHSYSHNGTYTIILRVYDNAGNVQETMETIKVLPKSFPFTLILAATCIGLAAAMIGGVISKKRKKQQPSREAELYSVIKPIPPEEKEIIIKKLPVSKKAGIEEIDETVFNYIASHGGTISLSQAAAELNLTIDELKESIERLKQKGMIE